MFYELKDRDDTHLFQMIRSFNLAHFVAMVSTLVAVILVPCLNSGVNMMGLFGMMCVEERDRG